MVDVFGFLLYSPILFLGVLRIAMTYLDFIIITFVNNQLNTFYHIVQSHRGEIGNIVSFIVIYHTGTLWTLKSTIEQLDDNFSLSFNFIPRSYESKGESCVRRVFISILERHSWKSFSCRNSGIIGKHVAL
jgi:hypothetical protein